MKSHHVIQLHDPFDLVNFNQKNYKKKHIVDIDKVVGNAYKSWLDAMASYQWFSMVVSVYC